MFRWAGDMRKFQHNTSTYETASVKFVPYLTHDFKVLGTSSANTGDICFTYSTVELRSLMRACPEPSLLAYTKYGCR